MALTKDEKELLKDIRDDQKVIREDQIITKTVLLGVNGKDGLVDEVKSLAQGHGRLKKNFWILVGILLGSGVIGGSAYGLFNVG